MKEYKNELERAEHLLELYAEALVTLQGGVDNWINDIKAIIDCTASTGTLEVMLEEMEDEQSARQAMDTWN